MTLGNHSIDPDATPRGGRSLAHHLTLAAATVGTALALAACGSKPPPPPTVATAGPPPPQMIAQPPPPMPSSPTASQINISDEILKACGIEAPKAHFGFDSAHLRPEDTAPLDKIKECFTTGPLKGRTLRIVGHADPRGETEYNFVLGNSRADAVSGYLGGKGMDKAKLQTSSRGELDAVGTDETGWTKDRRVDLLLAP